MVDSTINTGKALSSMEQALRNDVNTKDMQIKRMGPVNTDASLAMQGWVGLYADSAVYSPRAIGTGVRRWTYVPIFRVIVQAVDRESSSTAHEKLEDYIKKVLDVILDQRTLGGFVETINQISIQYAFNDQDRASLHYIGALITLEFEGQSN